MSQEERFGKRCGAYSAWHRRHSTARFVGVQEAMSLSMIDVDGVLFDEYDDHGKEPLLLVESARDELNGRVKPTTCLTALARRAGIPAYLVLYTLSDSPNPASRSDRDISVFKVRRLWPDPEPALATLTPQQWATRLLHVRKEECARLNREPKERVQAEPTPQRPQSVYEQGKRVHDKLQQLGVSLFVLVDDRVRLGPEQRLTEPVQLLAKSNAAALRAYVASCRW